MNELIGYNIMLILILGIIILSSILLAISNKYQQVNSNGKTVLQRNTIGISVGVIMLFASFTMLIIAVFGIIMLNPYFIIAIGILFLFTMVMLLVAFFNKSQETFVNASGPCFRDGQMGILVDGECQLTVDQQAMLEEEENSDLKKKLAECQKQKQKKCDESFSGKSRGDLDGNKVASTKMEGPVTGICEYEKDGKMQFGYRHPYFGKKCVSADQMDKMLKANPKQGTIHKVKNVKYNYNPFQSTQCFGYPKTDMVKYDLQCKSKFGKDYGMKSLETFGCPENDYRAVCEQNFQMGEELEPNSTKCVPIGTDMNTICQMKHLKEKTSKYLKLGYEQIKFSGCPEGTQRALCNGNYYNGEELFKKSTAPFPQTENSDRKCQQQYGLLSFSKNIISDNCSPGYIRAICN